MEPLLALSHMSPAASRYVNLLLFLFCFIFYNELLSYLVVILILRWVIHPSMPLSLLALMALEVEDLPLVYDE